MPVQLTMFDAIEIPITKGRTAFVDPIDADLANHKWHFNKDHVGRLSSILMHRVVMSRILGRELLRSEHVDHIDGNILNNRNTRMRRNNTSGYKGVWWHKNNHVWVASIKINGKMIYAGFFTDVIEAARAYDKAAIEHFGEFARTNVMLGLLPSLD